MGEIDLLSARDAIEQACWEIDLIEPRSWGGPRQCAAFGDRHARSAAPGDTPVSAVGEVRSRRPGRRRGAFGAATRRYTTSPSRPLQLT